MIREKLGRSERQIRFRAAVATPTNLRELLNDGCRMLHYTGHGNNEMLAFESDLERQCGIMKPLEVGDMVYIDHIYNICNICICVTWASSIIAIIFQSIQYTYTYIFTYTCTACMDMAIAIGIALYSIHSSIHHMCCSVVCFLSPLQFNQR